MSEGTVSGVACHLDVSNFLGYLSCGGRAGELRTPVISSLMASRHILNEGELSHQGSLHHLKCIVVI